MPYTNFIATRRMIVNFDHAHLSASVFRHANAKDAQFYGSNLDTVDFTHANLQRANFTKTVITKSQLQGAFSIRNAQLPDQTFGRDLNLIDNGPDICNDTLIGNWKIQTGKINRIMSSDSNNCLFVLKSYDIRTLMLQHVNLSKFWDSHLWPYSQAVLYTHMGKSVSVQLNGINRIGKIVSQRNSSKFRFSDIPIFDIFYFNIGSFKGNITLKLHKDMHILEILVGFNMHFNKTQVNESWCEDMDLFIDYGIESEIVQSMLFITVFSSCVQIVNSI